MALPQLLLEEFVAGPGAGQEQPETLGAETRVRAQRCPGGPQGEGSAAAAGSLGWDPGWQPPPRPLSQACQVGPPRQGAELCWGPQEGGMRLPSGSHQTHLRVHRDEAQELVHVAHEQPVGVEFHGGLHLLGSEEVLQGLVHLLALGAAHTG